MPKGSLPSLEGLSHKQLVALAKAVEKKAAERQEPDVTTRHPVVAKLAEALGSAKKELNLKSSETLFVLLARRLHLSHLLKDQDAREEAAATRADGAPRQKPGPKPSATRKPRVAKEAPVTPAKKVASKKAPSKKAAVAAKKPTAKKAAPAKRAAKPAAAPAVAPSTAAAE